LASRSTVALGPCVQMSVPVTWYKPVGRFSEFDHFEARSVRAVKLDLAAAVEIRRLGHHLEQPVLRVHLNRNLDGQDPGATAIAVSKPTMASPRSSDVGPVERLTPP
jgi:hypothetical protein